MTQGFGTRYTPSGNVDVKQHIVHGYEITYNPDTGRFHVHGKDPDKETLGTYRELRNAVAFAKATAKKEK